jgi:serine/threonine protein kinase
MLYGLDWRQSNTENGTDLGVARKMIRDQEVPLARAVPIRTLYALMKNAIPGQSGYSDGWHMNKDLDKATGAFMYTLLTGDFPSYDEPADSSSSDWKSWKSTEIGHQTAWTLSTLNSRNPNDQITPLSGSALLNVDLKYRTQGNQLSFSSKHKVDQIMIFSIEGQTILEKSLELESGSIDLTNLKQGFYIIQFNQGNKVNRTSLIR